MKKVRSHRSCFSAPVRLARDLAQMASALVAKRPLLLVRQWKELSWLSAWFQRPIATPLMHSMDLGVIKHRGKWGLSRRDLTQELLVSFEQRENHPGHPPEHFQLPSRVFDELIIDGETREQALIDLCPRTIQGSCSRCHEEKHLLHRPDASAREVGPVKGNIHLLSARRPEPSSECNIGYVSYHVKRLAKLFPLMPDSGIDWVIAAWHALLAHPR